MKIFSRFVPACLLLVAVVAFVGCGGSAKTLITVTGGNTRAIDNGQNINITVTTSNDGGKGVSWSCSGACSSTNLTNQTTTSVTFTASAPGTATITATSLQDSTVTQVITVTVTSAPGLTGSTLPVATEGTAYNQALATVETGGAGTLTWSISAGQLPAGLSISSTSGAISGTPTGPASATADTFTVKVVDSGSPTLSATAQFSITVNNYAAPTIAPASGALAPSTEGTAYSQTFTVTNGHAPYTLSITNGSLPAGITPSSSGAQLIASGTPTGPACAACSFSVQVVDSSNPPQTATNNYTLAVNLPPAPSITTASLPAGTEGTTYNQTVQATGGLTPYTFSLANGTLLPVGLSMNSAGNITGTPTGPNGMTNFTVQVADHSNPQQTATKNLSITVNLAPAPVVSPTTLPNGNQGTPYSQTLSVSGGLAPFVWSVSSGTLPTGLVLSTNNPTTSALLSGTPTTAQANVQFTIQVIDSSNPPQPASQAYTVTINPPAPLSITTSSPLTSGTFNSAYNTTISATGGIAPYVFSIDAGGTQLPAGLSFNNSNNQGVISGTPTTAGTFSNILVDLHDSQLPTANTTQKAFMLTITANSIVISPSAGSLPSGTQNTNYNATISATGGVPPYTFALDATSALLPAGLGFSQSNPGQNNNSGVISGTPTATGTTSSIIVDVTDSEQPPVTQKVTYSVTINPADPCANWNTGSESLLSGSYVFLLKGFDNGQGTGEAQPEPVLVGGVLGFNASGTISSGTIDVNGNSTNGLATVTVSSGTYKIGSDHRACFSITPSAGTTIHYAVSLGNISSGIASTGHMIDLDGTGPFTSGVFKRQTAVSISNGSFAFEGSSAQNSAAGGGKFALAGAVNLSNGNVTGGEEDINTNGTLDGNSTLTAWPASAAISLTGGSYSIANNGRGTFSITFSGGTGHNEVYLVSGTDVLFMSSDPQTNSIVGGEAFKQSGSFSQGSLSGNIVIYLSSLNGGSPSTSSTTIGLADANGSGTVSSGTLWQIQNNGGTNQLGSQSIAGVTYSSPDSSGRVLLGNTGGGGHAPLLYLVGTNEAFLLGSGGSVETGMFEPQASSSAPSGSFAFGTIDPQEANVSGNDGVATFSGSPLTVSGTTDNNSNGGGPQTGQTFGPLSVSTDATTGVGIISSNSTVCTIGGINPCQLIFYPISATRAVLMEIANGHGTVPSDPSLQIADQ